LKTVPPLSAAEKAAVGKVRVLKSGHDDWEYGGLSALVSSTHHGTAEPAAEKVCTGQESNTSGAKVSA
jgi:hypothetical protein